MKNTFLKRLLAMTLTMCMVLSLCPVTVFAADSEYQVGDVVTIKSDEALSDEALEATKPAAVEKAVWVSAVSNYCYNVEHTHSDNCYYKSCDHSNGHISTCYSESTEYALCEHSDDSEHTGTVTLADVVTINGTNVSWITDHPAYPAVYAVYKAAYDEAYASAKYMKELAAKAAGVAALTGKTFCYTTSPSAEPDLCTHTCSEVAGSCYTKICVLSEHTHVEDCYVYTWTLKADINSNGVADDEDIYYTVKYVSDGETLLEESVLVGMPTPTVADPVKPATAQYTYTFTGWDSEVAATVTADVTYTAVFSYVVNTYTVTWLDEDGTVLETDVDVEYGTMPSYDGAEPAKEATLTETYAFSGWTPALEMVTGDATYTATYTTKAVYTVAFVIDGETVRTEYVIEGETVAAYVPTREYYVISVWYTDAQLTEAYDFASAVAENTTLYAQWIPVTDTNNDGIADEEQMNTVTVIGNVTCTVPESISPESEVTLVLVPVAGKYITSVTLDGEALEVTYSNAEATVTFVSGKGSAHVVEAATADAAVTLTDTNLSWNNLMTEEEVLANFWALIDNNGIELNAENTEVTYLAYDISLASVGSYTLWTNLSDAQTITIDYVVGSYTVSYSFGDEVTETVKISFPGNDQVPAFEQEFVLTLVDNRIETTITLNEGVVLTYSEELTAEEIYEAVDAKLTSGGEPLEGELTYEITNLNAGTQTVTVKYAGTNQYASAVASVEVTIEKATAIVTVDSANVKYGTQVNVSELIDTGAAQRIEIAVGLSVGANASADGGVYAYVNLPAIIDTSAIENETIRAAVEKALDSLASGNSVSVSELKTLLENVLTATDALAGMGIEVNLNKDSIEKCISLLAQIENIEGFQDIVVYVTIGEELVLSDAGAYLVGGVISDANYNTAVNVNYVVITPDGYKTTLDWVVENESGYISLAALRNGYDLNAYVVSVAEGNVEDATAHLAHLFVGVDFEGNPVVTTDVQELEALVDTQDELGLGGYIEIAFIRDLGNVMYYAKPIARAFVIVPENVELTIIDKEVVYDGNQHSVETEGTFVDSTASLKSECLTVTYVSMNAMDGLYHSTTAPVNAGVYAVYATYVEYDANGELLYFGADVGSLVINLAEPQLQMQDVTVCPGAEYALEDLYAVSPEALHVLTVIVDEDYNVNVILPTLPGVDTVETFTVPVDGQKANVLELIEMLPEEVQAALAVAYAGAMNSELADELQAILDKLETINSLTVNGALPAQEGVYATYGLTMGRNYAAAVDTGVLTIVHKPGETVVENELAATCTTDGSYNNVVYCTVCGEELSRETVVVPALGHTEETIPGYPATCTETGLTDAVKCSICDEILTDHEEIPALGHTEDTVPGYAATCTETGLTDGVKCAACDVILTEQEEIPALGHDWLEATCTEPKTCDRCGATEGYPMGHTCITQYVDPTCTEEGYTLHTCLVCDEVIKNNVVPALGHTEETIPGYPATCTEPGLTDGVKCSVCDEILTEQEEIPATGHNYEDGKCTECGEEDPEYLIPGLTRLSGYSRYDTALKIAEQMKETLGVEKFSTVVVAYGGNYPDALSGSYLASMKQAPMILTHANVQDTILTWIAENLEQGGTVYVLGGNVAVPESFTEALNTAQIQTKRLSGHSRYDTNLAILKEAGISAGQDLLICTGTNYADSLSASATGLPILLVGNELTDAQKELLAAHTGNKIIIGGNLAVSDDIAAELGLSAENRLAGQSRYDTSVLIAERYFSDVDTVVLAYAQNYPDGLAGSALAAAMKAPLILTDTKHPDAADNYVDGVSVGYILGGEALISDDAARNIFDMPEDTEVIVK